VTFARTALATVRARWEVAQHRSAGGGMEATAAGSGAADRRVSTPVTARIFAGRYLSLTSYRRDGTAVATPVWFVQEGGLLLVQTGADSGKVKRIKRDPSVAVAVCSATGRLKAAPVPARAWLLPDDQTARVERLLAHKYRFDLLILKPLRRLQRAMHPDRAAEKVAALAIRPG
jgi:uncharacterized protein